MPVALSSFKNRIEKKNKFSANIQHIWKNANKLHFQCTDFNSSAHVTCMLSVSTTYVFYHNLVLVAECHVDC